MAGTPLYTPVHLGFIVAVGAHAATTRITYTVPAGKIARLTSGAMTLGEQAGVAFTTVSIRLLVNGVIMYEIDAMGAADERQIPFGVIDLTAGDIIRIDTLGTSAVVCAFSGMFHIREYS